MRRDDHQNKNELQVTLERINNKLELKAKQRTLRKNPTRAEHVLWQAIRMVLCGVKFHRQFSGGRYILDFYCHELKLAVEADGYTHDSPDAKVKDRVRQKDLEEYGIRFLRFTNEEILSNVDKAVTRIKKEIEKLRKPTHPDLSGSTSSPQALNGEVSTARSTFPSPSRGRNKDGVGHWRCTGSEARATPA
jgi:very-short-patch-repair endonuclease